MIEPPVTAASPIITPPSAVQIEVTALGSGPYAGSPEHIHDELARIDQLVRAQTVRWRASIAADKQPKDWGMAHLSEGEIDSYLRAAFRLPRDWGSGAPASQSEGPAGSYVSAAARFAEEILSRREQTPATVHLRLAELQSAFRLSDFERDALLVCLLPELDGRYRWVYGYLQDDLLRTRPSVELILQILAPVEPDPRLGRAALLPDGRLASRRLLRLAGGDDGEALPLRSMRVDDRIVDYLLGGDGIDSRLEGLVQIEVPVLWDGLILGEKSASQIRDIVGWRRDTDGPAVLFLHGPDAGECRKVASAICADLRVPLMSVDAASAMDARPDWRETVDLSYREATLHGAALLWFGCDRLLERGQPLGPWEDLVSAAARHAGLTFLQSQTHWEPGAHFTGRPFLRVELPVPTLDLRRRIWEGRLPPDSEFAAPPPDRPELAELLATSFQMTESQVLDAISTAWSLARQRSPQAPELTVPDLFEACRRQAGRRLMTFAQRIEPRTALTFEDLVLPKPNMRQLQDLRSRIRVRDRIYSGLGFEKRIALGKGVIALFTGASGTGKTMTAELLAHELGVDLYKVDLASIVSKWVGETEKNLAVLFSEAEDANAIIFFDEADALFGKRGEVKEAKDRWANTEVNFLLQRVEEYAGVVILATNLRQNIDEAFLRRIHVIVDFPAPDAEARLKIWLGMFPEGLQRPGDEELQDLAERFRLSGGSIRNIVVDGAYRALAAAHDGPPAITLRQLVISTAREYEKLGKPLTRGEFGDTFFDWIEQDIL